MRMVAAALLSVAPPAPLSTHAQTPDLTTERVQEPTELREHAQQQKRRQHLGLGQAWVGEIVPGVFRVGTTYVGCYVVEDAGAYTFIDTGLPGYWQQIVRFLAAHEAPLSAVKAVVLTHSHVDHIGNAERLRKEAGATVLVHAADLAMAMRKAKSPRWRYGPSAASASTGQATAV